VSTATLFTIGHSNRTLDEFFTLLHDQAIRQLIDVRSLPQSRRYPSYNRSTLSLACEDEQIAYAWFGRELGGLRSEKSGSRHCALTSNSFRGYADHMGSRLFLEGIDRLTALARAQPVAIMCAEREPSQCHRSMIADYLSLRGWPIIHLLAPQQSSNHSLNPLARSEDNTPIYDLLDQEQLDLGF
jgi:uncharacterized protein (DUF488 family)